MDFDDSVRGVGVPQGPVDWILVAIGITIRIQKFFK